MLFLLGAAAVVQAMVGSGKPPIVDLEYAVHQATVNVSYAVITKPEIFETKCE